MLFPCCMSLSFIRRLICEGEKRTPSIGLINHRCSFLPVQICAVLAAVTEVIRSQGGKETETEYFAALVSRCDFGSGCSEQLAGCSGYREKTGVPGLWDREWQPGTGESASVILSGLVRFVTLFFWSPPMHCHIILVKQKSTVLFSCSWSIKMS
jgi:hypothetical protein